MKQTTLLPRASRTRLGKGPGASELLALVLLAGSLTACAERAGDAGSAPPEPVVNESMNVSFASLPEGFDVVANADGELRLEAGAEAGTAGEMWLEVGERSDFGIQLTDIVSDQKAEFEALPGGSFGGNRQLQTQAGVAFYSRGGYTWEGTEVEETRIFMVHPTENRLVTFHYRYPAGADSAEKIQQLFEWVGSLEAATGGSADLPGEAEDSAPGEAEDSAGDSQNTEPE